jgi:hypothetical protein
LANFPIFFPFRGAGVYIFDFTPLDLDLPLAVVNTNFSLKNTPVFGFRQKQGKSGHLTYQKRNLTSDVKTMFFGADIRSRIFGIAFP